MAGYTRYDTSNNIATGNVINAADLDGEFDALVAAFHASTGHVHDGTAANGAPITKLGPAQEYVGNGTSFSPKTTAVYDLGTSSLRWNNLQVVNLNASNTAIEDGIIVSGRSGGTSSYRISIVPTTLTASRTVTLPDSTGVVILDAVSNIFKNASGQTFLASSTTTQDGIVINGRAGGSSSYRATIVPTTLTASRTITLPDSTGVVILDTGSQTISGAKTFTASNSFQNASGQTFLASTTTTQDGIVINGRAGGTNSYRATFVPTTLTGSRTLTIPDVSGTLLTTGTTVTVSQGGTGAATLTANNVILGNGTSAVQFVAPGTNGNVLTSNGTTWTSAAAPTSLTGQTDSASPYETSLGTGAGSNSTGVNNTFVGYNAGNGVTSGTYNVAVGYEALTIGGNAAENVAIGNGALDSASSCSRNVAIGHQALQAGPTGATQSYNTVVGWRSLFRSTADRNTALGYNTAEYNTTGTDNIYIGYGAGSALSGTAITTGTKNILIGKGADASSDTATNQIVIGTDLAGVNNSNVTIGSSTGKIYNAFTVNATWTQTSDGTMKNIVGPDTLGLSFIKRLNPIKYTWKPRNELPLDHPYYSEVNHADTTTVIHGFVAQEVKAALDVEGCDTFNGWDQGADGIQAISREMFISPLVKAVQELAAQVEALQAEIAILKAQP